MHASQAHHDACFIGAGANKVWQAPSSPCGASCHAKADLQRLQRAICIHCFIGIHCLQPCAAPALLSLRIHAGVQAVTPRLTCSACSVQFVYTVVFVYTVYMYLPFAILRSMSTTTHATFCANKSTIFKCLHCLICFCHLQSCAHENHYTCYT